MNVELTKLPESRVALKIELSPDEVEGALDRTYKDLVRRVNVPGFRKGKAPRSVVERMIGHELFVHEATEEAIRWGYRKAIESERLVPIDEAEIDAGDHDHIEPGESFQFDATVAVRPDVELPDYHALSVERAQIEVTDEDVENILQEIRERNATLEPTIRAAEVGDVVSMNIAAKVGGDEVINQENADFELRDEEETEPHPMLPGLSKELVGTSPGDIKELSLHLPAEYGNPEHAGKTMFVRVLVKEIKRKVLPALDDELAQSVSELQTLDELRELLRGNLEIERRSEADEKLIQDALTEVTSRTFVEIPPLLVEEELDRTLDDMRRMLERQGLSLDAYLEATEKTEVDVRADMRETAIDTVKRSLVLGAVAEKEKIEITNEEIDAGLEELFRSANLSNAERRRLRNSTNARANIRSRIRRQRAIHKLVEAITGEEVSADAAEAMADQTAAAAEDAEETLAVEVGG